jgi:hypothetical protein
MAETPECGILNLSRKAEELWRNHRGNTDEAASPTFESQKPDISFTLGSALR